MDIRKLKDSRNIPNHTLNDKLMRLITILALMLLIPTSRSSAQELSNYNISDFRSGLRKGMSKIEVVDRYGTPGEDIRFGLFNYIYTLADSSEVEIGFTNGLLYATHRMGVVVLEEIVKDKEEELTLEYIEENLQKDMGLIAICNTLGVPDEVTGSGICIYFYTLSDSSIVVIGCTNKNVLYANHLYKNGEKTVLID